MRILWSVLVYVLGIVLVWYLNFHVLEPILIPDPCYYHIHDGGWLFQLFYSLPAFEGYHPYPSILNFLLTLVLGALPGYIFYKRFWKKKHPTNFERMMHLVEEVFATKNDPDQLDVNEEIIEGLKKLHPATLSEYDDGKGPVAWILLIPTTLEFMHQFIEKKISEKELYERTQPGMKYEALYLCSGLVLKEYRRKGISKRLTLEAIEKISQDHTLKALFVWTFSEEGNLAAKAMARAVGLPLYKR